MDDRWLSLGSATHRILLALVFLAPLVTDGASGIQAQPLTQVAAVDLLPADLFSSEWTMIGSRELDGSELGATAQFGGPNGSRIDLTLYLTESFADEDVSPALIPAFDGVQDLFTDPTRTTVIVGPDAATPPDRCVGSKRFDGSERHYEFFRAGGTLCILKGWDMVLFAFVGGDFNGVDGYQASDAVIDVTLDRIASEWRLP